MTDTNKKIFSEAEFDKPTPKENWFTEHIKQIVLCVLVVACVILALIFVPRRCTSGEKPVVDTLVSDTLNKDSVPHVVVENSNSVDSVESPLIATEEKNVAKTTAVTEVRKTEKRGATTPEVVNVPEDVVKEALSVIRGKYGNNPERRRLLKDRYQEIQNKVNEMYRKGQVY